MTPALNQAAAELRMLERGGHYIRFDLAPSQAFMLLGLLQLALRHPGNAGVSAEYARTLAASIEKHFASSPALAELAKLGWEEQA